MLLFAAGGFAAGAVVVFYALLADAVTRTRVSARTIGIFLFFTHSLHLLLLELNDLIYNIFKNHILHSSACQRNHA
jgi:hypothetical protein